MAAGSDRMQTLSPRDRVRLTNILSRLSSSFEGERAAAGLLASAFIAKHGLNWSDFATGLPTPPPGQTPERPLRDRRHNDGRAWKGYCRRRSTDSGHALNRVA